jgi:hypothetical protein
MATASALFLVCGAFNASAEQRSETPMMEKSEHMQHHPGEEGTMQGGMMGCGMMRPGGVMGRGMMGQGGLFIMRIVFALMDSDGDGTVSLQESQVAHEKIFKAMDANKDGVLTMEEMQSFMMGSKSTPQRQ